MKRILAMILTVAMCFGMPHTAFAAEYEADSVAEALATGNNVAMPYAGTETWSGRGYMNVGTFTMHGHNLTPVKTVGLSASQLCIAVDSYSSNQPVYLTVQIRRAYTTQVLAQMTLGPSTSGGNRYFGASIPQGTQIQIDFRVTDANGNYNSSIPCTISYSYFYVW